tara:strand:+ start:2905 stop:3150 length:246 start_codon:yes stop_codon:yes gene_type:complete
MKFPLTQLYKFNRSKPTVQVQDVEEELQWDECDLTGLPPERLPGSITDHGKIPKGQWDNLPKMFKATNGNEYSIEGIIMLS